MNLDYASGKVAAFMKDSSCVWSSWAYGSGKSVACCMEIGVTVKEPNASGKSRWAVIRNADHQLKRQQSRHGDWFDDDLGRFVWSLHIHTTSAFLFLINP